MNWCVGTTTNKHIDIFPNRIIWKPVTKLCQKREDAVAEFEQRKAMHRRRGYRVVEQDDGSVMIHSDKPLPFQEAIMALPGDPSWYSV